MSQASGIYLRHLVVDNARVIFLDAATFSTFLQVRVKLAILLRGELPDDSKSS
jgi:hypothetical protein